MVIERTAIHQIYDVARQRPNAPALHIAGQTYTYRELLALANALRERIRHSAAKKTPVGILTHDDVFTYASILAVMAEGLAFVPINLENPADRVRAIIDLAEIDVVLVSAAHEPLTRVAKQQRGLTLLDAHVESSGDASPLPDISPDELAYLFFTSGSTGVPKGVPIYHRNLTAFLNLTLDPASYRFSNDDRFLQMFELSFDLSVTCVFTPLCLGASCFVVPRKGIAYLNIIKMLQEHHISVALMVPSVLAYLKRFFSEVTLPDLRYSLFCGEALPDELVSAWSRCVPNAWLQNCYGPTEATIYCLFYDWHPETSPAEAVDGVVPIGRPVPGMGALVLDADARPAARGERGELCLYGAQVTDQYWRNPEKTQDAFVNVAHRGQRLRVYRTGDLCYENDAGMFVYCGRLDHQVKIDGHRIELAEIEHYARECTDQALVAAIGVQDASGTTQLRLFFEGSAALAESLAAHLSSKLPGYMVPRDIVPVARMPLNTNGKIDRKALAELETRG